MPFYFRKSVSAGPFRFNFSKSGVGVSVGVKGLRFGTGPKGHYVHAGRGGIYYRASLNSKGSSQPRAPLRAPPPKSPSYRPSAPTSSDPNIEMVSVSSGDVLAMEDARFADLLAELRTKQNSPSMAKILGWVGAAVALFALMTGGGTAFAVALGLGLIACGVGGWLDSYQRCAVLFYELEDDAKAAYERLTLAFDGLSACATKWHVDAGGTVRDIHTWKRNSGASHVVSKSPTVFQYALPGFLKCNITPPAMKVGKETLLFLPDVVLVVEKQKVGAVAYDGLEIAWQDSRFIEDGAVPRDAQIVGQTWKHPNKDGGPDRRFASNYQIPICLYESIYLSSSNGLNELLQVSQRGRTQPLSEAAKALARATGSSAARLALPPLADAHS